jgi:hypothetical protein
MLGKLRETAVVFGGEQAFLDGQFADGDFQRLEVANFLDHRARRIVAMPVAVIVIVIV